MPWMSLEPQPSREGPCRGCGKTTRLIVSFHVDFRGPNEHFESDFECGPCLKARNVAQGTWFEEDEADEQIYRAVYGEPR